MNITKESTGPLTAIIKIEIIKADYEEKVNKVLKDYQRKSNMPGFRPGKVPAGLIRKMYGRAVMMEEINSLISESLSSFLVNEKLDILGNPLPNMEKNQTLDFDREDIPYDFYFDIGIAPDINTDLTSLPPVERYLIQVSDDMINHYIEDTRRRFGKHVEEKKEEVEKKDEEKKEPEIIPAEMNVEFFEQVFPGKEVKTEEEFRNLVKQEAANSFIKETDHLFYHQVSDKLVEAIPVDLPDEFLKRWLLEQKDNKLSPEEVDKQYGDFSENMRWQLIENKIIRDNEIKVTDEDIRHYILQYFLNQPGVDKMDEESKKRYDAVVDVLMKNKEQVQKINDELFTTRLTDLFKEKLTIENKEVSYEEFIKLASAIHHHAGEEAHEHEEEHDHEAEPEPEQEPEK
ncbi:MAG: trigger factor [Bacteroidota bacterium]|nr:trigger factor [Bacteroidota bacterium]